MDTLLPDECRALGTLIEKAMTTPGQYPLSLNGLVTGINQKSNRDPVVEIDEDRTLRAVDGLRTKGLVRDVSFTGSRVEKYRHVIGETLGLRAPEQALLAELLLRGPQTVGELRGRASRMQPFESIEAVENVLRALAAREYPLVKEIAPTPGSRAPRWMQLLAPDLHPLGSQPFASDHASSDVSTESRQQSRVSLDATRVVALETRVDALEQALKALRAELGLPN
ncbi:MAG: DUF480 domain-containing protein [Limnohabitans sp.]|jgi:uncharacterized protein YceH (UPF0502 family)|nr:DUF480 domain-containing protein [Limnohabitans sp.]